jgi:hypothetical protein
LFKQYVWQFCNDVTNGTKIPDCEFLFQSVFHEGQPVEIGIMVVEAVVVGMVVVVGVVVVGIVVVGVVVVVVVVVEVVVEVIGDTVGHDTRLMTY